MTQLELIKTIPSATTPKGRFLESHPNYEQALKFFNQKELKGLGLIAISSAIGLIARQELSFEALGDWLTQRLTGIAGVDTGPTNLNPITESVSALTILTSLGYVVGGKLFNDYFKGTSKRQGLEPLPKKGRKKWSDHTVVIDVTKGIFDSIEELKPVDQKVVLVHDGGIIKGGEVEGGSLNSDTRRNLNSVGVEHLSDNNVISSMNPESAKEIIINLCSIDSILGSFGAAEKNLKLPISLEKTFNILMTLKIYLEKFKNNKKPKIKLIVPDGLNIAEVIELVGGGLNIEVKTPELIFVEEINKRTKDQAIKFVTDLPKLPKTLDILGLKTSKNSKVTFVYCSTDDKTIFEAAKLKQANPTLTVITCIERKSNYEEAKAVSDHVWEIPSLVAQKI